MRRYLVVANQTAGGTHLREAILQRVKAGPCSFHLVVPATPPAHLATWTEGQALAIADERLHEALIAFKEAGAEASGVVGDPNPFDAVADALLDGEFDEILLSTLPPGASRWLGQDLVSRVRRRWSIPVTHVVADE
jgi:hypothetical protein